MSQSPDKAIIVYTESSLAAKNGTQPLSVSWSLAEHYSKLGICKILNRPAAANPPLPPLDEQKVIMPEEKFMTPITWVTSSGFVDRNTRTIGENLGFKIELSSPTLFSLARLMQAELIIFEWPLKSYTSSQLDQLRGIALQKQVPYILRVLMFSDDRELPSLLRQAKCVLFSNQQTMNKTIELHGELFSNWWVEGKNPSPYDFWKHVDAIVNPDPSITIHVQDEEEAQALREEIAYNDAMMEAIMPPLEEVVKSTLKPRGRKSKK